MSSPLASDDLHVATPERVALALPVAGIGSRSIAYLADIGLIGAFWTVVYFIYTLAGPSVADVYREMSGLARAVALIGAFASQWLYWTVAEVFWQGQTPGKRLMRIRVVREDGTPIGFFESAVRNLLRLLDFLPAAYAVGLTTMLLNGKHRRLGDLLAGTLLVREERIDLDKYVAGPVTALPVLPAQSRLEAADAELILAFLERAPSLTREARERLGRKMLERYGAELSEAERSSLDSSVDTTEAYLRSRAQAGV